MSNRRQFIAAVASLPLVGVVAPPLESWRVVFEQTVKVTQLPPVLQTTVPPIIHTEPKCTWIWNAELKQWEIPK